MAETEDCRTIAVEFVETIGEGRLDDARRLLHDELVTHAADGLPYSGDYHGPAEFCELLGKIFELLEPTLGPIQYLVDSDQEKVVMYYRLKFTARASGASVEMNVAEVLSIRDGLIAELDVFYKDPSAVAALLAA
jgi:ketosteroid isomerase-like protein